MSAKEMFERLGYTYQESYLNSNLSEIVYNSHSKFGSCLIFNLTSKTFKITRFDNEYKAGWCDIYLLQAINKQVEELGWKVEDNDYL